LSVFLLAAAVVLLQVLVLTLVVASDPMMAPALPERGWIVVLRVHPGPRPGDVVGVAAGGKEYIRRVLAVGRQKVTFKRGVPVVDGKLLPQEDAPEGEVRFSIPRQDGTVSVRKARARLETVAAGRPEERRYQVWQPVKPRRRSKTVVVPPGEVFVVCDNRAHCKDSRHFGTIPAEQVWAMWWRDALPR